MAVNDITDFKKFLLIIRKESFWSPQERLFNKGNPLREKKH